MQEPDDIPKWDHGVNGDEVPQLINRDEPLIRVEAGPGTGKTLGLKRRVVRLLHPYGLGLSKNQVLVVAFNRVIAADLRGEIKHALEEFGIGAKLPRVRTLHALCLEILGPDTRMLMPHERDAMLYDVVNLDNRLAEQFKGHPKVEQALHNHEAGNEQHNLLRQVVQLWLNRHGKARLVGDLPAELVDGIKGGNHPDPRFEHVLVDEFQDLTEKQHHLVFALVAENGNLVALGDRRQSIYRFLGNDPEGLARLETLSKHKVCDLPITSCHRCPAEVVSAANQLMEISGAAPMTPGSSAQPNTHVVYWKTPQSEAKGMAKAILENFKAFPAEKHLVMVTKKKFGTMLRDELNALDSDVNVDLNFQEGILDEWAVREAFLILSLLVDPDPPSWRAWLAYKNDPTGDDYLKTNQRNSLAYLDLLTKCKDSISEERLSELVAGTISISGVGADSIRDRAKRYFELKGLVTVSLSEPSKAIAQILNPPLWITDKYSEANRAGAKADLDLLTRAAEAAIEEEVANGTIGDNILKNVVRSLRAQVSTRDIGHIDRENSIKVATLWGAKGVTAHHVYVLGLCEEALPGIYPESYQGTETDYIEEQRRLLYVSLTRSKGTLVLSRAEKVLFGEASGLKLAVKQKWGSWGDLHMTPFLREIIDYLPKAIPGAQWQGCIAGAPATKIEH